MKYLYPEKIILNNNVIGAEYLSKIKPLQIGLMETNLIVFPCNSYIILDFGKEIGGSIRILTYKANGGSNVRLRMGESVSETSAEIGFKNATNDHSLRDMVVELKDYSDMTFGHSGFRFLRIDNLSKNEIKIKSILAFNTTDQRKQKGTFFSDDKLVNDIFDTASYTIRMCLNNGYFWDGVKRDRLVWIGDLYPEMKAAHCIFGDVNETFSSLDFAMNETNLPDWMAGIPAYSLWWLIILADEFKVNGEKNKFTKYIDYAKSLVNQISCFVGEDGVTTYPFNFIDWPTQWEEGDSQQKKLENLGGMSYLTKIAMEKTGEFLRFFNEDDSLCKAIIQKLNRKKWDIKLYKQIGALGVLSGEKTEEHKKLLLKGGAKGLSTFMSYPVLTAISEYGCYREALSIMKDYYGGMLSVGATTFWEDFDIDWLNNCTKIDELPQKDKKDIHGDYGNFCYKGFRHSLCHGWSAGVISYLYETVAGLHFKGAGMKELEIKPHLSGLKHVKVTCTTKYGLVTVEHTLKENGTDTKINVPDEIKVIM